MLGRRTGTYTDTVPGTGLLNECVDVAGMQPQPRLTYEELDAIRSNTFADDIDIDIQCMSRWTRAHATAFFQSGAAIIPPSMIFCAAELIADAKVDEIPVLLGGESPAYLLDRLLTDGRQSFLQYLHRIGVKKLVCKSPLVSM